MDILKSNGDLLMLNPIQNNNKSKQMKKFDSAPDLGVTSSAGGIMSYRAVVLTAALLLALAVPQIGIAQESNWPPPTPEQLHDEVLREMRSYYADFSRRDWEAFREHFWPGATLTTVWAPPGEKEPRVVITTIGEFIEQAPYGPGSKPIFEERMLDAEIRASGNLAQARTLYSARFGDPGDVAEWRGVDAFTLIKHDGRWRIVSLSYMDEEE